MERGAFCAPLFLGSSGTNVFCRWHPEIMPGILCALSAASFAFPPKDILPTFAKIFKRHYYADIRKTIRFGETDTDGD